MQAPGGSLDVDFPVRASGVEAKQASADKRWCNILWCRLDGHHESMQLVEKGTLDATMFLYPATESLPSDRFRYTVSLVRP